MKKRGKALLLDKIHPVAAESFSAAGYEVKTHDSLEGQALAQALRDVHVLGIRSKSRITKEILMAAEQLQAIGAFGIGTNQIDIKTASAQGVAVFNAPYGNARSVVELAMAHIFALLRCSFDRSMEMHQGRWNKKSINSHEVRGKLLGIVGYGNIGSQLSVLAEAVGMKVIYYDLIDRLSHGNATSCPSLNELLKQADIVSLHIDGGKSNERLMGEKEFSLMKKGALFLNLSRGTLVDIAALVKAIKSGRLGGAAIDAFPTEPKTSPADFKTPLQGLDNVILTPHLGGSTEEAQRNIARYVPRLLLEYMHTGGTFGSVNLPNVRLSPIKDTHRMLHIHQNVPGMLAAINRCLANNGCNVLAQHLKTSGELGYVISDIDKRYKKGVVEELMNIEHTVKLRILS